MLATLSRHSSRYFMAASAAPLRFPYMFWAHREAHGAPFPLSQSGVPTCDPEILGVAGPIDLSPPSVDALPELERALAVHLGVAPERVLVALGASGAMHLVAMRFFPGSRVVTEVPSYEPFRALAELYASSVGIVERLPGDGFRADPERFSRALGRGGRSHLFLCNPHNPTGAYSTPGEVVALARAAERAGGLLISNEIYLEFAELGTRSYACSLAPNTISIGSLTKAYGLGPLRIGWVALGEGVRAERESLADMTYLSYVDPPTVTMRAARAALDRIALLLEPARELARKSRPLLERWLASNARVSGELGPLGLVCFPGVEGVADTRALSAMLARDHGVVVVPGEFFGMSGHVRIGYGLPEPALAEALERLEQGLSSFSG